MKRNMLTLFILVLCFIFSSAIYAQNTIVTLGGSWWNAAYSSEDEDGEKIADIGNGNNFGPYISINHGKVNFGASLLWGTFPIDDMQVLGEELGQGESFDMSRNDMNFTLGYRIHRYINIFVGAKYLNLGWDYSFEDYYGGSTSIEYDESGMLYGLGLSGVIPLGSEGLYLFGSLAGMGGSMTPEYTYTSDNYSESEEDEDISAALAAINLGVGYRFPSGFGINAGYRADLFTETFEDMDGEEYQENIRVQGLIVTASYSF